LTLPHFEAPKWIATHSFTSPVCLNRVVPLVAIDTGLALVKKQFLTTLDYSLIN